MGQKVNPYGLRLGINKTWKSKWYVDPRDYADSLHEDLALRKALVDFPEARGAEISDIQITRKSQRISMMIYTARPGVIIGSKGANIEQITQKLQKMIGKTIQVKINEIKQPEADAQVIAMNVARQLKTRSAFRRTLKLTAANAMKAGAKGIKIKISGRLGGAEMARTQEVKEGRIPLHTLRADIDYGFAEANTTFGLIGVKVWVFKGEVYGGEQKEDAGLLVSRNQREKVSRS